MLKTLGAALLAGTALLGTGAAFAGGHVSWSIGINAPLVGYGHGYAPLPVYAAAPVYMPAPVYVALPAPVYYRHVGGYYRPVPVLYPRYERGYHRHRHGHGWRHD